MSWFIYNVYIYTHFYMNNIYILWFKIEIYIHYIHTIILYAYCMTRTLWIVQTSQVKKSANGSPRSIPRWPPASSTVPWKMIDFMVFPEAPGRKTSWPFHREVEHGTRKDDLLKLRGFPWQSAKLPEGNPAIGIETSISGCFLRILTNTLTCFRQKWRRFKQWTLSFLPWGWNIAVDLGGWS